MNHFLRRYLFRRDLLQRIVHKVRYTGSSGISNPAYLAQSRLLANRDVKIIFDVGAFQGNTVNTYTRLFPGALVHAFEPTPAVYETLAARYANTPTVETHQAAVGATDGQCTFHMASEHPTFNSTFALIPNKREAKEQNDQIVVDMVALDAFCTRHHIEEIDAIKFDIQGGELDALRGASGLLSAHKIGCVYMECQIVPLYEGQPLIHDLLSIMHDFGYALYDFYHFKYSSQGQVRWCDGLFISPQLQATLR